MNIEERLNRVNVDIVTFTFDKENLCEDWIIYNGEIKRESESMDRLIKRKNYDSKSIVSEISNEYRDDWGNKKYWLSIKEFIAKVKDDNIKILDMKLELKDKKPQ